MGELASQIFSFYPNPANTTLTINLNFTGDIFITNLLGQAILEKHVSNSSNGKIELDISSLSSGFYLLKAGNEVEKFLKE